MNDAVSIARDLVRCPSVTPADAGALGVLENAAESRRLRGAPRHLLRARHRRYRQSLRPHRHRRRRTSPSPAIPTWCRPATKPPGRHGAFSGDVKDGFLYGRGAVDMKGGIACSVAAVLQYLADHGGKPKGSISFLITGDEEDISVNGTIKLLKWVRRARREIRPLRARRALQCRGARRLHQDRPPRLAIRHALCRRRAGPCRLSAPRGQSGAGYFAADRGAQRRAARSRQRAVPGLQPRIHLGRRRQHREQRHPRPGAREIQHPLQRQPHPGDAARRWSRSGWPKPAATASARASCGSRRTPTCSSPSPAPSPISRSARSRR